MDDGPLSRMAYICFLSGCMHISTSIYSQFHSANPPQAGAGYLNNWNFADKEVDSPPSDKPTPTKYVNEAPEGKKGI